MKRLKEDLKQPTNEKRFIKVQLVQNGSPMTILIPVVKASDKTKAACSDGIGSYARLIIEFGMIYRCLNLNVQIPNWETMLPLLKIIMCFQNGKSNNSKYALEILKFMCEQTSLMSEKTAYESFYGMFVNKKGKGDTSFPADLQMEYLVRSVKGHLKAVQSNKSEKTITTRTSAFAGMTRISEKFNAVSRVIIRSQKHKTLNSRADERILIDGLRKVRPFIHTAGRVIDAYPQPVYSPLSKLVKPHLVAWIKDHQYRLSTHTY